MHDPSDNAGEETDSHLLIRSRDGDRHAFSELWRRHAGVAVAYARSLGSTPSDPEDVVSEAFVSILHQLRAGRGPQRSFRPYLLTTVKNIWMSDARRTPVTNSLEDAEHPASTIGNIDLDAMMNSTALAAAFDSLPERWQHALWLSEVEQLPPRQIAEVLRIRPNSAAALTYRARDALRKAWIRAHLREAPDGTDHARVIELLGAYARDDLAPRSERFVSAHLDACRTCRAAAREAKHLSRAMTLGPLLAGGTGLVLAPALFPADQAAAAVTSATGVIGWTGAPPAAPPLLETAGHLTPLLWPVAAATAVALSITGTLFVRPDAEPDATGALTPAVTLPSSTASAPPAPVTTAPAPLPAAPVPAPAPSAPPTVGSTVPGPAPTSTPADKFIEVSAKPGDDRSKGDQNDHGAGNAFGHDKQDEKDKKDKNDEQGDDDLGDGIRVFASSESPATIIVSLTTDAAGCTLNVWVRGRATTALVLLVDGQTVGTTADAEWSGGFEMALTPGDHTLSVHSLDDRGEVGQLVAQTSVSAG